MELLIHEREIVEKKRKIKWNEPEIFVDNEKKGRSGHMGHALTEFAPGKIMAFHSNCSPVRSCGHSAFGWMEYRVSEDYGQTWGESVKFPFSWETFLDGVNTVSVEKVVTCNNGDIVAFCLMNGQEKEICCEPWDCPMTVISKDGGKTWEKPVLFSEYKGRIYDAVYHKGVIYALEFCNDATTHFCGNKPEHVYRLFQSTDEGKSFEEVCVVPFADTIGRAYGNMIFTEKEELIIYAYNLHDEENMDYIASKDYGKTWGESKKSYVANKIRNPQVGILDGQYILHGRAGESEGGKGSFVIYTSANGIDWDEGTILVKDLRPACFYSENLTVTLPNGKQKMLVKYSENYHIGAVAGKWGQVNSMMATIESLD
ncbi:MAG: exo-alpha-sialidase [Clostridia bacterium]|nr:exo-alpha-sialidase [Clostridia bacterium]